MCDDRNARGGEQPIRWCADRGAGRRRWLTAHLREDRRQFADDSRRISARYFAAEPESGHGRDGGDRAATPDPCRVYVPESREERTTEGGETQRDHNPCNGVSALDAGLRGKPVINHRRGKLDAACARPRCGVQMANTLCEASRDDTCARWPTWPRWR